MAQTLTQQSLAALSADYVLVRYVADTAVLPTFAIQAGKQLDAFLTLREHFPKAWEVHCIAVRAEARRKGLGKVLMTHAEGWLVERGVDVLQVKTLAEDDSFGLRRDTAVLPRDGLHAS